MSSDWSSDVCSRSEEHTSELQSHDNLECRLLLEKRKAAVSHADPKASIAAHRPRGDDPHLAAAARERGGAPVDRDAAHPFLMMRQVQAVQRAACTGRDES